MRPLLMSETHTAQQDSFLCYGIKPHEEILQRCRLWTNCSRIRGNLTSTQPEDFQHLLRAAGLGGASFKESSASAAMLSLTP